MTDCKQARIAARLRRAIARTLDGQSTEQLEATRERLASELPANPNAAAALELVEARLAGVDLARVVTRVNSERPAPRSRTHR